MEHSKPEPILAIGLMSGTSADGIDAAAIRTNGVDIVEPLGFVFRPYDRDLQARILSALGERVPRDPHLARDLTLAHIPAVECLLQSLNRRIEDFSVIGFHGHTLAHAPHEQVTVQIGNGKLLGHSLRADVVDQFRIDDVLMGGQGAPLIPLYHHALALQAGLEFPCTFLNIGGVSNITLMPTTDPNDMLAFDTGPGNALLDDWMRTHTGNAMDKDGACALSGTPDETWIARILGRSYFREPAPKSLDRNAFHAFHLPPQTSLADGAATLSRLTAACVQQGISANAIEPKSVYVCGGGRLNPAIMAQLNTLLPCPVEPIEKLGFDGDAIEAQGFAYLAVRSLYDLPISLPKTTGVPYPLTGGHLHPYVADQFVDDERP